MRHGRVPQGAEATRWLTFFLGSFPALEVVGCAPSPYTNNYPH